MKLLDLALNAGVAMSAVVFLAYVGYHYYDWGLFTTLPENISGFFLRNGALQYIALSLLVGALVAKYPVGRALKRQDAERRN